MKKKNEVIHFSRSKMLDLFGEARFDRVRSLILYLAIVFTGSG